MCKKVDCSRAQIEERGSIGRYVSDGGDVTDPENEDSSFDSLDVMELGHCSIFSETVITRDLTFLTPVSEIADVQEDSIFSALFEGEKGEEEDYDDDRDGDSSSDSDEESVKSVKIRKSHKDLHNAAMNLADLVGGKGTKSSESLKKSMRNVENLMVSGGLFGIRKRAVSDRRGSEDKAFNPHDPAVLREHSSQVLQKLKAFQDMSVKVGTMYGKDKVECDAAVAQLIESADVASGQFR